MTDFGPTPVVFWYACYLGANRPASFFPTTDGKTEDGLVLVQASPPDPLTFVSDQVWFQFFRDAGSDPRTLRE
jgi:hypothetical protein